MIAKESLLSLQYNTISNHPAREFQKFGLQVPSKKGCIFLAMHPREVAETQVHFIEGSERERAH